MKFFDPPCQVDLVIAAILGAAMLLLLMHVRVLQRQRIDYWRHAFRLGREHERKRAFAPQDERELEAYQRGLLEGHAAAVHQLTSQSKSQPNHDTTS